MKLLQHLQGLLVVWVIYLVLMSVGMMIAVCVIAPLIVLIFKGRLVFPPPLDLLIKAAKVAVFAGLFAGTVVWIKEVFFGKKQ